MFSFKCTIASYSSEPSEASVISRKRRLGPAFMNCFSSKKRWVGGPSRSEQLPLVPGSSLVSYTQLCCTRGSVHTGLRAWLEARRQKWQCSVPKQMLSNTKAMYWRQVFKLKIREVEGKLEASLIFPDLSTGDLALNC